MRKIFFIVALMLIIVAGLATFYYTSSAGYTNAYTLKKGENSIVFTQADIDACSSSHPTDVFSSIIDEVTYVMRYNSDTGLWDWYDFSDSTGTVTSIKADVIYKVYVKNACTLLIG